MILKVECILIFLFSILLTGSVFAQPKFPTGSTATNAGTHGNGNGLDVTNECSIDIIIGVAVANLDLLEINSQVPLQGGEFELDDNHPPMFLSVTYNGSTQLIPVTSFLHDTNWAGYSGHNTNLFERYIDVTLEDVFCDPNVAIQKNIDVETNLVLANGDDYPVCSYIAPGEIFFGVVPWIISEFGNIIGECNNSTISKQSRKYLIDCHSNCYRGFSEGRSTEGNEQNFSDSQSDIIITPNPFNQHIKISFQDQNMEPSVVRLLNIQGKLIKNWTLSTNTSELQLLIDDDLPKGLYYLRIEGNDLIQTKKIIKN